MLQYALRWRQENSNLLKILIKKNTRRFEQEVIIHSIKKRFHYRLPNEGAGRLHELKTCQYFIGGFFSFSSIHHFSKLYFKHILGSDGDCMCGAQSKVIVGPHSQYSKQNLD